jgi:hypothetical protein
MLAAPKASGEHTRLRVCCSASRRTEFSGGTPEIAREERVRSPDPPRNGAEFRVRVLPIFSEMVFERCSISDSPAFGIKWQIVWLDSFL